MFHNIETEKAIRTNRLADHLFSSIA